jgi:XRE family transcriptional regulator
MKLIKLNVFESLVTNEKAEEIYLNADKIISVRQTSEYSEIDVAYQNSWRRWKVQETIEEIQEQLEGKPAEVYIDKHKVGKRIQAIRFAKGMDQKQFSDIIHATVSALSNWENGNNLPNKERLKNIADSAGITVQKLLEG